MHIKITPLLLTFLLFSCDWKGEAPANQIMTVLGPIATDEMGITLEHEHAIVDFTGAEMVKQPQYSVKQGLDTLLPYFAQLDDYGVRTFIECTPNYIGRDVLLLKKLSKATGLHIITNTGYYAAANKKFIPKHAYTQTPSQLAEKWIAEWVNGIEDSGVKPGFIKLGVAKGPLDDLEQKLVHAGAKTHLATGLKVAIHTGGVAAASDEIDIMEENEVDPAALIIVHSQNISPEDQVKLAKRGAWISLDGVKESTESIYNYTQMLINLKNSKLLGQTLISQDAYWQVRKNDENKIHFTHHGSPYSAIFKGLIPSLKNAGFTQKDIDQLLIINPAEAFKIEVLSL